ncbi:MAG: VWA domain-containing protein [Acidobacteria bacterium]|nr:VWA domain-containing protein [Acidobacteriota bacterium]
MMQVRTAIACMLSMVSAAAQVGRNKQSNETPTFQSTTQLVNETVTVKDKDGKPVTGLTARDFTLTEDGAVQEIRFFEHQQLEESPAQAPIPESQRPTLLPRLTRTQIAPEAVGEVKYRDRRLLALYFDLTAMPLPDQLRAYEAAKKFIRTQMTAADLVAVMAFQSGSVQVLQDFTPDRAQLLSVIETMIVGEDEYAPVDETAKADSGAAFGQNDSEFNIFFTDRQLSALQTAAVMLGRLNEKKSLIYFASGLRLNGTNNQAQLHATINAAIRAGVSFWPVDARGLVAQAPMGDATRGSPGGRSMYTGEAAGAVSASLQRSQDTLWTLGADTGGKALLDYNDLSQGIVEAQKATSSYYILGYYTTNQNPDGKFRKIQITLANGLKATLEYRKGYFAKKEFTRFSTAGKERQLEDALMLGDPVTDLTIAMEIGYFQLNRAEYFVPVAVKIPGSELALARRRGAGRTLIDFLGEVRDEFGTTVTNVRDKVDIKLTGATVAELARRPIEYDTGFTLLPGRYKIKFLARDSVTGRMGTFEMPFYVPNLNKEIQRTAISSVVLSSQRTDLREALYNAKDKGQQAMLANPLVLDGQKLIPSVTRVFSRSKDLYVYLQAYQQGEDAAQPFQAYVTMYRGQAKALETAPVVAAEAIANRLRTVPVRFSVPLTELAPGEYVCQVTVVDAARRKTAYWRAPVMVIP